MLLYDGAETCCTFSLNFIHYYALTVEVFVFFFSKLGLLSIITRRREINVLICK